MRHLGQRTLHIAKLVNTTHGNDPGPLIFYFLNEQRPSVEAYQNAMNGTESSGQWKAQAVAPNAPERSPAIAPVSLRFVAAPLRRNHIGQ